MHESTPAAVANLLTDMAWYGMGDACCSVVDFGSMLQTFPNYYSLGPNIQFFAAHGVRGVFEEGPGVHTGDGTDMEELKDYVMAEMLWVRQSRRTRMYLLKPAVARRINSHVVI